LSNKIEYNACIGGASSIGMGSKTSQIKTQKKEIKLKTRWILINHPAHMRMRRNISVTMQDCTYHSLIKICPAPVYMDTTTTVET
jgi:ferredoxin-like protein FixX